MKQLSSTLVAGPLPKKSLLTGVNSNFILGSRFLMRKGSLWSNKEKRLIDKNSQLTKRDNNSYKVTQVNINDINFDILKQAIKSEAEPILIKGFAKDAGAVKSWTPEFFKEHYGDTCLSAGGFDAESKPLNEIIDLMVEGSPDKQKYVQAVADIFNLHPELLNDLPLEKIKSLNKEGYHGAEIFMGGNSTGSPWHAANEWTFFYMVNGVKDWVFIPPEYSLEMETLFQKDLIYVASKKYFHNDPGENVPKYYVTVEPGDLLIFPCWWWHRVHNKTDITIGVATRFRPLRHYFKSPNTLFSWLQLTVPQQWKSLFTERMKNKNKDDKRYLERSQRIIS